ncbi:MAG: hypothetical protein IH830_03025 [Planctomycetes bacterium]|nr:hypothetical protein [Planctomycetota bacterium]
MNDDEFFKYVLSGYEAELKESDRLYGRCPLILTANVVIGGLVGFLTTDAYLGNLGFLELVYYCSVIVVVLFLAGSLACLAASIWKRTYERTKSPDEWDRWRSSYEDMIRKSYGGYTDEEVKRHVAAGLRTAMAGQMMPLLRRK